MLQQNWGANDFSTHGGRSSNVYLLYSICTNTGCPHVHENNIDRFEIKDIYKILEQKYQTNFTKVQDNIRKAIKGKCIKFKIKQTDNQIINFFRTHDFTPKLVIILGIYKLRKMYPPAGYDEERIEKILYSFC